MRFADAFPMIIPQNLTADRASRVFDHRQSVSSRDGDDLSQITGHAKLMHAEDGLGARGDGGLQTIRVKIVSAWFDVNEYGYSVAIADAVGRGDERMTDGDHFAAGFHAHCPQSQVQCGGATRHRTGVQRADQRGKLPFVGRHLRPLRHPTGTDDPARSLGFCFFQPGT